MMKVSIFMFLVPFPKFFVLFNFVKENINIQQVKLIKTNYLKRNSIPFYSNILFAYQTFVKEKSNSIG